MDLLERHLDAVAFRAYSLPEVAAAWTCLAAALAAAAAAGLWRRRSSTAPSDAIAGDANSKPLESERCPPPLMMSSPPEKERLPEPKSSSAPAPRERYTAYYYDDSGCVGSCYMDEEEEGEEDQDMEDEEGVYGPPAPEETDPFQWEVVRSLPLTAPARYGISRPPLGGSVVRLWDQAAGTGRGFTASPRRRSGTAAAADLGLLVTPKYCY
ncbi:uncharacterized protein LOC100838350 [Brachypodium distachyon]|uniref:Uncharacterized protein n=1 Tax=Brachypodium distachyon TaxID=15368 RepID=I1H031_BRADI|nr:uncharacterized protein LOC100838350 [Brachypodium distachyon]PNT76277.1 hypothetical protein BRADI_1g46630v3 [Brachypodium distachyon]|eukprot:XP_003560965.1 uncharacterized protein LOC100838350 [Brachypodium distachyon]